MTRSFVIPKRLVWEAFKRVKAKGGGAGVDQESIEKFEGKLGDNPAATFRRRSKPFRSPRRAAALAF
jgi:RNA-directed DNA polymerase